MTTTASKYAIALLALLLLAGCGGGGGGGPASEPPTFTTAILAAPTDLRAGEPFSVTHEVAGTGAGIILETTVLWATSPQPASISAYPNRGPVWRIVDAPGEFTGGITSPFAGGRIYLRAYARVEAGGTRVNVLSDEVSIPVRDVAWTGPATEDVTLLFETGARERFGLFGYVTSTGYLHSVAGATLRQPDGSAFTMWFGDDGLPAFAATSAGLVLEYVNWTDTTVDVRMSTAADGLVHQQAAVPVCPTCLVSLEGLRGDRYIGDPDTADQTALTLDQTLLLVLGSDRVGRLMRAAGIGMSLVGEIAQGLSPPGEWTDELAALTAPLGGPVVPVLAAFKGDETISQIDDAIDGLTCFTVGVCLDQARTLLNQSLAANGTTLRTVIGN